MQAGDECELGPPSKAGATAAEAKLEVLPGWQPACNPGVSSNGRAETGSSENGGVHTWRVRMLPGPQAAPDYFTEQDMQVQTCCGCDVVLDITPVGWATAAVASCIGAARLISA